MISLSLMATRNIYNLMAFIMNLDLFPEFQLHTPPLLEGVLETPQSYNVPAGCSGTHL